ncbi:DUF4391 domain-containing protein [Chitinispirillales bacterium ANBcel5]|uniref:DUF4391 domain-containing protein n=1 Tax=Cellulosispirillum alkaliphilum TaxID=3039283 RepID=UPI002A573F8B|nr:DUF4391 domain-containing protein [Chitinispirillales bacterium ANBcel5]
MVNSEINLPKQAYVNKFVPKSKFYERTHLSSRLQKEFTGKIQRITWKYKLAEETVGITKTEAVTEIQIFELELKAQEIPERILKVIDKAIPYQILYKFVYNGSVAWGITLKQGNKAENYYFSEWDAPLHFDFTGIDLEKVYQKLVRAFIGADSAANRNFGELVANDAARKQLESEIIALNRRMKREKQFNRKVDLNKVLLAKKQQLEYIKQELSG